MNYKQTIGLEVHISLNTKTKTFCNCANTLGAKPNTLTCPVCLGLPGAIPSVNKSAIELIIMAGILFDAKVSNLTTFERKNFYSEDMPKGYQLCQFSMPICSGGQVVLSNNKVVKLNRIHLEEDSAKTIQLNGSELIDFNRSGAPILEIVAEPTEMTTEEVVDFLDILKRKVMFSGISACRMENGEFRFDVNISVSKNNNLGTRIELKNITSTKMLSSAIEYERNRQITALENDEELKQETRVWSEDLEQTVVVRAKENVSDYRHFPDPDLSTIRITQADVRRIKSTIPESFESRVNKYLEMGLTSRQISIITSNKVISDFVDNTCKLTPYTNEVVNFVTGDMLKVYRQMNRVDFDKIIEPQELASIIDLMMTEQISRSNAKILFEQVVETGRSAINIAKEQEMMGKVSKQEIEYILKLIIEENPIIVDDFNLNRDNVINYIIGAVKTITSGRAIAEDIISVVDDVMKK